MIGTGIVYRRAGLGLALAALAGCASVPPPPTEEMTLAKAEVSQAQNAGAMEYAPVELRNAQSKLDQAQKALQSEEHVKARRLAEQADVDAKLASAKAQTAKAQKAVAQLQEGIRVLRQELERKTR